MKNRHLAMQEAKASPTPKCLKAECGYEISTYTCNICMATDIRSYAIFSAIEALDMAHMMYVVVCMLYIYRYVLRARERERDRERERCPFTCAFKHTHIHACTHAYIHTCIYIHIHIYICLTYVFKYLFMYLCIRIYEYAGVISCIYIFWRPPLKVQRADSDHESAGGTGSPLRHGPMAPFLTLCEV